MRTAKVTFANRVRAGDELLDADDFVRIQAVRKARGRKPAGGGETLDFITDTGAVVKRRSTSPVRVRRGI